MKRGAKTNRSGKILEYIFEQLSHYGFQEINGVKLVDMEVRPPRFVHTHSGYRTIYGTQGYHEGFIVADEQNEKDFIEGFAQPKITIVVECKFQSTSGSVDEKIPYVFENFKESESDLNSFAHNWILVLDGDWWTKTTRGKAVVNYAKEKAKAINDDYHRILVISRREFKELVARAWGPKNG